MKQYCKHCHNWRPLDDTFEIGVCSREPELPITRRFRFKHEIWTCWKLGAGAKAIYPYTFKLLDEPEAAPEFKLEDAKVVAAEFRREMNGQVTKAYWYVRKLARAARVSEAG